MKPRDLPPATILTSGIGLGVYIPALLIQRRLERMRLPSQVEVLEEYYRPENQKRHSALRNAVHRDFALALLTHRMARSVDDCLDHGRVEQLLEQWATEGRRRFMVWSGFWLPILERYHQRAPGLDLDVDICRIDAEVSASFRVHRELEQGKREIWLWNWEQRAIVHEIPVTDAPPLPFAEREERLVVHGGGWGIGTYQTRLAELASSQYALDVVVHDRTEAGLSRPCDGYFIVDPEWRPWQRSGGRHVFPPFGRIEGPGEISYRNGADYHDLYDIIRRSKAIVSKPGGGTLIDSLSSATPVVLLEPYGYAEERNGAIWEHLGFGVSYSIWRDSGYDSAILARLQQNLLSRAPRGADYPKEFAERLARG